MSDIETTEIEETAEPEAVVEEASGEVDDSMSVADFRPTPFRDSAWEIVGESIDCGGFQNMEVRVVENEEMAVDPMFFDFGQRFSEGRDALMHSTTPGSTVEEEETSVELDESLIAARLAESFEAGKAAGIEEGAAQAQAGILEKYEALNQQVVEITSAIREESKKLFTRMEKEAVELALAVAKKILISTADVKVDYIVEVIRKGLENLGAGQPLQIRVSPRDMEFIEVVGLPVELSKEELGAEFIADEGIHSGCVIETDFGEVDLELEKMWEQVAADLYEVYKK